jgi:hypothetical protein
MPHSIRPLLPVLLLLGFHLRFAWAARDQFKKWYPEYGFIFDRILHTNCTKEYDTYLHATKNTSHVDRYTGGGWTNQLAQPVVNCILENTSEFIKSSTGSAQVLLGLTPSMLAVLGPSTEETSLLFVIGRRPFLALCIAAGSPAVFPMRSFDNKDPIGLLKDHEGRLRSPPLSYARAPIIVALEYLVVIAAIANIATLSKELGVQVVCNYAPHLTYLVLLWAFLILIIHGSGSIALFLRARVSCERSSNTILRWIRIQFTPFEKQRPINVHMIPETYWFTFFSWFTAILTVCHVIYGTLTFSSMLFISVKDSITVIGRYFVSVICCRIVLMYELATLRDSFNVGTIDGSDVELRHDDSEVELRPKGSNVKSAGQFHTW